MADQKKPAAGGGGKKIMGVDQKTFFIVGGAALGLGLLYFYMKGKQTPQSGQGQGQGSKNPRRSGPYGNYGPTGLNREHIVLHVHDNQGHKRKA